MIRGKSPNEIRKLFNISSFTPEEEAQIQKENVSCCFYHPSVAPYSCFFLLLGVGRGSIVLIPLSVCVFLLPVAHGYMYSCCCLQQSSPDLYDIDQYMHHLSISSQ